MKERGTKNESKVDTENFAYFTFLSFFTAPSYWYDFVMQRTPQFSKIL